MLKTSRKRKKDLSNRKNKASDDSRLLRRNCVSRESHRGKAGRLEHVAQEPELSELEVKDRPLGQTKAGRIRPQGTPPQEMPQGTLQLHGANLSLQAAWTPAPSVHRGTDPGTPHQAMSPEFTRDGCSQLQRQRTCLCWGRPAGEGVTGSCLCGDRVGTQTSSQRGAAECPPVRDPVPIPIFSEKVLNCCCF